MLDFSKAFHLMHALECPYKAEREGKSCLKRLKRSLDLKVTLSYSKFPSQTLLGFYKAERNAAVDGAGNLVSKDPPCPPALGVLAKAQHPEC